MQPNRLVEVNSGSAVARKKDEIIAKGLEGALVTSLNDCIVKLAPG